MYLKVFLLYPIVQFLRYSHGQPYKPFFREDYVYLEATGSFYKLHEVEKTWFEAKKICAEAGATLFVPEDQNEVNIFLSYFKRTLNDRSTYIGVTDLLGEGVFETIDGRPISQVYHRWAPNEPNDAGSNEDCVMMGSNGDFNDVSCGTASYFTCKKMRTVPFLNGQPYKPFFREDYVYLEATGSFYKLDEEKKTWFEAKKVCADAGATLFVPEDQNEVNIFWSYFNRTLNDRSTYIGVTDLLGEGVFETIDGRPISQVYHRWAPNEPNDAGSNEDCVMMRSNGDFNDVSCGTASYFTCKKMRIVPFLNQQREQHFFRKDYKYLEATGSFYKIHTAERTWFEAKRMCASEGAKLFIPEDQIEVDIVLSHFKDSLKYRDSAFVGISDLVAEGVFETIDGRSILDVFHKWRAGEPNNQGDQDCVELLKDGYLNDNRCKKTTLFICKKTASVVQWNLLCNMPFLDYNYNENTGRCYKFHSNPANWTDAHALCAAEQSYLAVTNSQEEANYLVQLTVQQRLNNLGDYERGTVFLGFHNQFDEGWTVVRGTTVEDSGYNTWAPGQPDGNNREKCGSMLYNGHLNAIGCDKKSFFICEHDINIHPTSIASYLRNVQPSKK